MNNDLKVAKTLLIEISNIGREIFFKLPNYDNMLRPVYCVYKENERSNISEHFKINAIKFESINLKDSTIYRYPNINLPREKVDSLKTNYNLSVTRDETKANYRVISKSSVTNLFEFESRDWIRLNDFLTFFNQTFYVNNKGYTLDKSYKEVVDILNLESNNCQDPFVITIRFRLDRGVKDNLLDDLDTVCSYSHTRLFNIKNYNTYLDLTQSSNFVLDSDILKFVNSNAITLTHENYYYLTNVLENSNFAYDVNMVLTTMANCNYESSFDILALLIWKYDYKLKTESDIWNSINVKTLRSYFDKYFGRSYSRLDHYSNILDLLFKDGKLTEFAFKIVSEDLLEYMQKNIGFEDSIFEFQITDIKLKENIKASIVPSLLP